MPRLRFLFVVVLLTAMPAYAVRQSGRDRLHFKISLIPARPKLLLPRTTLVDMSALNMEKDNYGMMHLKGAVEIRMSATPQSPLPLAVLRTDEAVYDVNTGEIEARGDVRISAK